MKLSNTWWQGHTHAIQKQNTHKRKSHVRAETNGHMVLTSLNICWCGALHNHRKHVLRMSGYVCTKNSMVEHMIYNTASRRTWMKAVDSIQCIIHPNKMLRRIMYQAHRYTQGDKFKRRWRKQAVLSDRSTTNTTWLLIIGTRERSMFCVFTDADPLKKSNPSFAWMRAPVRLTDSISYASWHSWTCGHSLPKLRGRLLVLMARNASSDSRPDPVVCSNICCHNDHHLLWPEGTQ